MSQLGKFVRRRAIDNVVTARIVADHPDNPLLFDIIMPEGRILTLAASQRLTLFVGDPVEVSIPSGDRRRAYISGPAGVVLGGDAFNRVLGAGVG